MSPRKPTVPRGAARQGTPQHSVRERQEALPGAVGPVQPPGAQRRTNQRPGAGSPSARGTARGAAEGEGSSRGKNRGTVKGAEPVAARSFSGRPVLLAAVLLLVGVIVTPALNNFLQQRAEIAAVTADIAYQQQRETDLRRELSRWDDPAYIRMQARDRVNMVMPGETGYWVYGNAEMPAAPEQAKTTANPEGRPWADGLWQSIVRSATE